MSKTKKKIPKIPKIMILITFGLIAVVGMSLFVFLPTSPIILSYDENDFDEVQITQISKEIYTGNNKDNEYLYVFEISYEISFVNNIFDSIPNNEFPSEIELQIYPVEITHSDIHSANHSIVISLADGLILKTIYFSIESGEVFPVNMSNTNIISFREGIIEIRTILTED